MKRRIASASDTGISPQIDQSGGDSIVTTLGAANLLHVSVATLNRLHKSGLGPRCSYVGGQRRYLRSVVLEWVKALETESSEAPRRGHRDHLEQQSLSGRRGRANLPPRR